MDTVLVDFPSGIARLDEVPGIFALMDPMPGVVEAYRQLADQFDTYILATAPWKNPSAWSDKLHWVQKYLGDSAHRGLILGHHKHLNRSDEAILAYHAEPFQRAWLVEAAQAEGPQGP